MRNNPIKIIFVRIHYFLYREFSSPTWKKITSTSNDNSRPKSQFDLNPSHPSSYIKLLKNGSTPLPSPITQREGGCKLWGHAHFSMNESNNGIRNNLVVLLIAKINIFKQQLTCYQWESLKQLLKLVSLFSSNFYFFNKW